jgi:hypothetical protein
MHEASVEQSGAGLNQIICHVTPEKRIFGVHGIMQMTVSNLSMTGRKLLQNYSITVV